MRSGAFEAEAGLYEQRARALAEKLIRERDRRTEVEIALIVVCRLLESDVPRELIIEHLQHFGWWRKP